MQRRDGALGRPLRLLASMALLTVVATGVVSAHQLPVTRFTAPVPLGYLYAGAAVTVALTAALSARLAGTTPARVRRRGLLSSSVARPLRVAVRAVALLAFAVVLWRGLTGRQVRVENLATLVTWALVFDGLPLLAALVGSPWRLLSPWRTLYDAVCAVEGERLSVLSRAPPLGRWPAVAGFVLVVGVFENLTVVPDSPRGTAVLVLAYTLVMFVGALAVGESWFDQADPVGVFLDLFGRVAPLRLARADDGGYDLTLRAPWRTLARPLASVGTATFVLATVYTVSFDGFSNTPEFRSLRFGVVHATGLPSWTVGIALYAAGLALFVLVFAAVLRAMAALAGEGTVTDLATAFGASVLPIAVGYEFAHYGPYVVRNAFQALTVLVGLVAASPPTFQPLWWLSLPVYWGFEVVAIVAGHVVAVVAAHYAAQRRFGADRAWRAHLPLVALMVAYTALSLWIITRPVVS